MALIRCVAAHAIYLADGSPMGPGDQDNTDLALPLNALLLDQGLIEVVDPDAPPPAVAPPAKPLQAVVIRDGDPTPNPASYQPGVLLIVTPERV